MGRDRQLPPPGWGFHLAAAVVIAFVRLMRWRVRVEGLHHIPDRSGAIIAFNHHAYSDFSMVAWEVYRRLGRGVRFLAKQELFERRSIGWILRGAKHVPVARGSREGRLEAFRAAVEALQAGELVAVAPEQTISQSFDLLPFSTGAVRMAQLAGVPIVPCIGWGSQRFATKGRPVRLARRIPVTVRYGPPIEVPAAADTHEATDELRAVMLRMLDEVIADYPEPPRPGDDWWVPRRLGGSAPAHEDVLRAHLDRETGWRGDQRSA